MRSSSPLLPMRFEMVAVLALALLPGCGDDAWTSPGPTDQPDASPQEASTTDTPMDTAADTVADVVVDTVDAGPLGCGTGNRPLPDDLVEIAWDDGMPVGSVRDQSWSITVNGHTYALNDNPLYEAVRFDLPHPARVYGFSVQFAGIAGTGDPKAEIEAGLYADFGYNGFDFWAPEPLWTGTRCVEDVVDGQWVTYAFEHPIDVPHPGLVYVAHSVPTPDSPVFAFDGTALGAGDCAKFDDCHSAMNLPDAETSSFFNGVSFPFQYDYLVRLYVEYTDDLRPEERWFQPQALDPKGHVSFGDYDNDGWDDVITDGPTLYRNRGDGTFEDATLQSGIAAMGLTATGGVWGDYDNDGCLDLFLYAESDQEADTLLHSNCDSTFTDATAGSGIVDEQSYESCGDPDNNRSPTAAAAWVDMDADGLLDLYLANFICWDKETYYTDTVFHNLGSGVFEPWTGQHGFSATRLPSRGVAPVDFDADGDIDVFVNAYRLRPNWMWVNDGTGEFSEQARALGLAGTFKPSSPLYYGHTIGTAWGDLDNDGDFDQIAANLAHPRFFDISDKTQVLIQGDDHVFTDLSGDWQRPQSLAGLRYQETHSVPALADFDQDGNLDLVITAVYDGRPTDFYWGNGDGTFRLDSYHAGITTTNGWGVAVSDIDNDGDQDVFAHVPFVNRVDDSRKGHWLQVRVLGNVDANWNAIGAIVRVTSASGTRTRQVEGGTGSGDQDSQYLHFGLGGDDRVDRIEVSFPGGKSVLFDGPFAANERIWVYEDGSIHVGWAP